MGKLYEILPVESARAGAAKRILEEAKKTFHSLELFGGYTKILNMFKDDRQNENMTEHKAVTTTVQDKLDYIIPFIRDHYDAFYQKEKSNQNASADIILIDGTVVATSLPACALLGLENHLKELREVLEAIPTLAHGISWIPGELPNIYQDEHSKVTMKTEKTKKCIIKSPATDKFPAQVELEPFDESVGRYTLSINSGCMSSAEKSRLIGRCDTLLLAVKTARQRANAVEANTEVIGDKLLKFIFE